MIIFCNKMYFLLSRNRWVATNEGNTKYMLSTNIDVRRIGPQIIPIMTTLCIVKEFIYLGSAVTIKSDVSLGIKRRITLANGCYYGLNRWLSSRGLSRTTKLVLYKTLIVPVLIYDIQTWKLLSTDTVPVRVFERKLLRKILGPVQSGDDFRIRSNSELYELLNDIEILQRINIQRLKEDVKRTTLFTLKGPNREKGSYMDVLWQAEIRLPGC